jgi:competence protein ComEA
MSKYSIATNEALIRLTKLISPRDILDDSEPREILLGPPENSVTPLRRLALITLCAVAIFWWLTKPVELTKVESLNPAATTSASTSLSQVVVHVAGEVNQPGIVKLPAGSRVVDAIELAGGLKAGVLESGLNLAALVEDGQLITVGLSSTSSSDSRINLNTATAAQLESLPGVGPVMAKRILDWREVHNRFSKISELQEIQGIGPKLFEQLKVAVRI